MPRFDNVLDAQGEIEYLVTKHRVCYEWSNEYEMAAGARLASGFSLRLYGANSGGHDDQTVREHPVPGCATCRSTYADLLRIAHWVMPKDVRESQYRIEPFDNAFHIARNRHWREEIVLSIDIEHRDGSRKPQSDCEKRCLREMCASLRGLGVLEGRLNPGFD